jgi:IS1 family transposase
MLVRGTGTGDISAVLKISITKVLKVLKSDKYKIKPKKTDMTVLKQTSFGRMWGKRRTKYGLIYAYHREGGIVGFVWGTRDLKTAKKLSKEDKRGGARHERIATDDRDSFLGHLRRAVMMLGKSTRRGQRETTAG